MARDDDPDVPRRSRHKTDLLLILLTLGLVVLIGVAGVAGVLMWRQVQVAQVMAREMAVEANRQRSNASSAAREAMEKAEAEAAAEREKEPAPPETTTVPGADIAKFINELVNSGGAQVVADPATLDRLLIEAARRLDEGGMRSSPLSEASARSSIGLTYLGLQRFDAAELQLRLAYDMRRRVLGTEHAEVLRDEANLKRCLDLKGR
ncbi:MAG: tetratricopeptide repeat protein [Phycisphaerales bacterium]